jgi:hypothetical protein
MSMEDINAKLAGKPARKHARPSLSSKSFVAGAAVEPPSLREELNDALPF